jgi:peptidoglycan hydrolase-like protein with peptidoglycan-binding domain
VSVPVRPNASIGAKCVEIRLRQLGLRILPADNRFDGDGVRALQQFQASVGLPATGVADQATLAALKLWRQPPTSSCKVSVTVRPASTIGARCVESRLWHLGITPGTVDDYFDGASALALARFQYAVGLPMTNIADKATLQAMGIWQDPPPNPHPVPANSGTGRRIVYSRAQQRIWAVNADGTIAKTHRVSGRMFEPYAGTYHVYSRSMYTYSANNPAIRWRYMVRFAYGPGGGRIGFHEIPNRNGVPLQSYEQLGLPLSGGCVRQTTADALWIWNWAPIGTKVVVL